MATVFYLATAAVLFMGSIRGSINLDKYFELKNGREALQRRLLSLETELKNINDEIHKIEESPDYAKKVLKDKYHITEPGEEIFFFGN